MASENEPHVRAQHRRRMISFLPPINKREIAVRIDQPMPITFSNHTNHWQMYGKRAIISMQNEDRIVKHLQKKMSRKLDRRLKKINEDHQDDENLFIEELTRLNTTLKISNRLKAERRLDMFMRYNETGDLLSFSPFNASKDSLPTSQESTFESMESSNDSNLLSSREADSSNDIATTVTMDVDSAGFLFAIRNLLEREPTGANFYNESVISPPATPSLLRPLTSFQATLSQSECVNEILNGYAIQSCVINNPMLYIFVSSAISDSQVERSSLIEKVFPMLKLYCLSRGYHLNVYDLHWGYDDHAFDDHTDSKLIFELLHRSLKDNEHINFLCFLGDKYGKVLPPNEILKEEFEMIRQEAAKDRVVVEIILERKRKEEEEAEYLKKAEMEGRQMENEENEVEKADFEALVHKSSTSRRGSIISLKKHTPSLYSKMKSPESQTFGVIAKTMGKLMLSHKLHENNNNTDEIMKFDFTLFDQWYVLNETVSPPVYQLQNISNVLHDILSNNMTKRNSAHAEFIEKRDKIVRMLQYYVKKIWHTSSIIKQYTTSEFENEITQGFLNSNEKNGLFVLRKFEDLHQNLKNSKACNYIDLENDKSIVDLKYTHNLSKLKIAVEKYLKENMQLRYEIPWHANGISPDQVRLHNTYINKLSSDVYERFKASLKSYIDAKQELNTMEDYLMNEIVYHSSFCHEKAKLCHNQRSVLNKIKAYIKSECRLPLVIFGKSGSGKTTILAKAVKEIARWFRRSNEVKPRCIVRIIGASGNSLNIRLLLKSICYQLGKVIPFSTASATTNELADDYNGLLNDFNLKLSQATETTPLLLFIDSLDRLLDDYNGKNCNWLPRNLPKHVHIVLSTSSDKTCHTLTRLREMMPNADSQFVKIPKIHSEDATIILNNWYSNVHYLPCQEHFEHIIKAYNQCQKPLYLKLIYYDSLGWNTLTRLPSINKNLKTVILSYFAKLEMIHGQQLTKRSLGYLAAAKHGLTDSEMEDILSLDEAVMDELQATLPLRLRHCPMLTWLRLKHALGSLLMERVADNSKLLCWSESLVEEAVHDRYLTQKEYQSYHKVLAEYFEGKWAEGRKKPYPSNDVGVDRCVTNQPLYFSFDKATSHQKFLRCNKRRLIELPWQLLKAGQFDMLKTLCLCNYHFIKAKIDSYSLNAILDDIHSALTIEPNDADLNVLSNVLYLSRHEITADSCHLATQLLGRLTNIIKADKPRAPSDPKKYPNLHRLFYAARRNDHPTLVPSRSCMTQPDGILHDLLQGHRLPITAFQMTRDSTKAVTASEDNTVKVWDLNNARVVKTIPNVGSNVCYMCLAMQNVMLVTSEKNCIRVWSMKNGLCLFTFENVTEPSPVLSIGDGGNILAAFHDGICLMRSWDLKSMKLLCEASLSKESSVHQNNCIVISSNSYGDAVLYALRGNNQASVINCRNGEEIVKIHCYSSGSCITSVEISTDYFLLALKRQSPRFVNKDIFYIDVFDKKGSAVRSIKGCEYDIVTNVLVNNVGSHAVTVNCNYALGKSDIAIWNLETEEHKHVAQHPHLSEKSCMIDFRCLLMGNTRESTLLMWNIQGMINQAGNKIEEVNAIADMVVMSKNSKYVITRSVGNKNVTIWNISSNKCQGKVVQIEKSLFNEKDLLFLQDNRIIILQNLQYSLVAPDSRAVYQTIRIYDLNERKFVQNLNNVFIVPSPPHEYQIIENDKLLGLSENRSHFIMWNIETGQIVRRIRPSFREDEKQAIAVRNTEAKEKAFFQAFIRNREVSVVLTPWDRRSETESAKHRRLNREWQNEKLRRNNLMKEKSYSIDRYIISGDKRYIVASFFAHHLVVFFLPEQQHLHTLFNEHCLLHLYVAAFSFYGQYLVHTNYNEKSKVSTVTLWDCFNGNVCNQLSDEIGVCAMDITSDGSRVLFGKENGDVCLWNPLNNTPLRHLRSYGGIHFTSDGRSRIHFFKQGSKALIRAGGFSLWDIDNEELLSVITPDIRVDCWNLALDEQLLVFNMRESAELVICKLMDKTSSRPKRNHISNIFGEGDDSTDSSEDDEQT